MSTKSYLIVCGQGGPDELRTPLLQAVGMHQEPSTPVCDFNLPQGSLTPKFGTFDNLIKLTEDLQKYDTATEGALRRVERQYLETFETDDEKKNVETNGDAYFQVAVGKEKAQVRVDAFLKAGWKWDEEKFPPSRSLQKNVEFLLEQVQQIDEQCRSHGQAYSDVKAQKAVLLKAQQGGTYPSRDLVDLLTPDVVQEGDFVETEHLTTVVVMLARGQDKEFEKWYQDPEVRSMRMKDGKEEEFVDKIEPPQTVIPGSLQQFRPREGAEDKEGNTIWRVVLFKSCKEKFHSLARQNKFVVRDFEYNASKLQELESKRAGIAEEAQSKLQNLQAFCQLAWSDIFTAWLHVKAMRCFVESVLRYGIPSKAKFAGFILCPKGGSVSPQLRDALARVMPGKGGDKADDADGEEYFPYVSLGFAPRAAQLSA